MSELRLAVSAPVETLQAAQARLMRLRREQRQRRRDEGRPLHTDLAGRLFLPPHEHQPAKQTSQKPALPPTPATTPPSPPVTKRPASAPEPRVYPKHFTLHPDLALAWLRHGVVAAGRLWLLLRALDEDGRGWVWLQVAQQALTKTDASLRLCGRRQLRNLLAQGEGIFWTRDQERQSGQVRIWLRSTARVAVALDVHKLSGRPVRLQLSLLLESIGDVRAHFYAAFHSGRTNAAGKPLARRTLRRLCRRSRQTQRLYEVRSGVRRRANWAVGPRWDQATAQERAWQHGRACFQFQDQRGRQGRPGETYLAWQLPNSYEGPHQALSHSQRKRANRQIADLLNKGTTGNGDSRTGTGVYRQRFYRHGQAAAKGYNRCPVGDAYWQSHTRCQPGRIWHLLPGQTGHNGHLV